MLQSRAFLEPPEICKPPELMKQQRGNHAKSGQHESGRTVMPSAHDARGRQQFDADREHEHRARQKDAAGLAQRRGPVDDLVERAEREQHDQRDAQQQGQIIVHGGEHVGKPAAEGRLE
jgi:hypothetical protein